MRPVHVYCRCIRNNTAQLMNTICAVFLPQQNKDEMARAGHSLRHSCEPILDAADRTLIIPAQGKNIPSEPSSLFHTWHAAAEPLLCHPLTVCSTCPSRVPGKGLRCQKNCMIRSSGTEGHIYSAPENIQASAGTAICIRTGSPTALQITGHIMQFSEFPHHECNPSTA